MKQRLVDGLTSGWSTKRFIGLFIGLFVAGQAFALKDALLGVLSAYFLYQIVTNTGCFGAQSCGINYQK